MTAITAWARWTKSGARTGGRLSAQGRGSFEALLGTSRWAMLAPSIRRRFSATAVRAETTVYRGEIVHAQVSTVGWLLAQLARVIGGPLPTQRDISVPATVIVAAAPDGSGQIWTRLYGRQAGFPQVIHSIKRFAGPTGLEEYLGCGFGIALDLEVRPDMLTFVSNHYFLQVGKLRLKVPAAVSPGHLTIGHEDLGDGRFAFRLRLQHAVLGCLMAQTVIFHDAIEDR